MATAMTGFIPAVFYGFILKPIYLVDGWREQISLFPVQAFIAANRPEGAKDGKN